MAMQLEANQGKTGPDIVKMLLTPFPDHPKISTIWFSDNPRRSVIPPFGIELKMLVHGPYKKIIIEEMRRKVAEAEVEPDIIAGLVPFGTKFSHPLAKSMKLEHMEYRAREDIMATTRLTREMTRGVFVDDYLIYGIDDVKGITRMQEDYSLRVPLLMSIVSADLPRVNKVFLDKGVNVVGLITLEELVNDPRFVDRFSAEQVQKSQEWLSSAFKLHGVEPTLILPSL